MEVLHRWLGREVRVKFRDGQVWRGRLEQILTDAILLHTEGTDHLIFAAAIAAVEPL